MRTKTSGIIAQLFKEHDKQKLLKLFRETRDLLVTANESQKQISQFIQASNEKFVMNITASLSSQLQIWLKAQKENAATAYEDALRTKNKLEIESRQVQETLTNEEAQLSYVKSALAERTQRRDSLVQNICINAAFPEMLRELARQNATSSSEFVQKYRTQVQRWIGEVQCLETVAAKLWDEIEGAAKIVQEQLTHLRKTLAQQQESLHTLRGEQGERAIRMQQAQTDLQVERQWWRDLWETIPEQVRPLCPPEGIFAPSFLNTIQQQIDAWKVELEQEETFSRRYDRLIDDWIVALHNISERDKQELREVYQKNANVVGLTCGQAPRLSYRDFSSISTFNVVIIDEVSKATPPELLLPAVRGKKLILIGDQHQLPPMIEDKTLDQMAEEMGEDPFTYRYLNESYFAQLYNNAPDQIKCMLHIQYRMHPDIMAAINQFYERPLECGLNQPDRERDHQFRSPLINPKKHLIWVTTPQVSMNAQNRHSQRVSAYDRASGREVFTYQSAYKSFGEERVGTSYVNRREVEIIKRICEEFQQMWAPKKAAGAEPKEIGVITFYAAQSNLLQSSLGSSKGGKSSQFDTLNIRIGTVDRFQGMERAVIIVSMVRNNSQGDIGFAKKDERINVAFSRAQQLLIIVGCHDLFCDTARAGLAVERYQNVSKIVKHRGGFIDISCI